MADSPVRVYKSTADDPVSLDPFQNIVNVHWGARGAIHLDGATYLRRASQGGPIPDGLLGAPDSPYALCSFWMRYAAAGDLPGHGDVTLPLWSLLLDDGEIVHIAIDGDGGDAHARFEATNVPYSTEHSGVPTEGEIAGRGDANSVPHDEWVHWLWSLDADNSVFQLRRNDVDYPVTIEQVPAAPFLIPYSQPGVTGSPPGRRIITLGADFQGASRYVCDLADFWFAVPDHFFDTTIPTLRRYFITADGKRVSLGADGQIPLGRKPHVFFTGGKNTFGNNRGTAGPFDLVGGPLTDATSQPA